ncbi:hypothetical protein SNA_22075 [Streptomyces natalensis ATCC 27448]|uniref:Uncharacterized protein n=1 Tax=Streptomyces natalensis ATCC 27448 TaxID=1240678 RepID=A0A0D7CIC5_9ACTN|nr:hypothetical protein SNA_22075 [Streptomyces natalensis ATCC 27448]
MASAQEDVGRVTKTTDTLNDRDYEYTLGCLGEEFRYEDRGQREGLHHLRRHARPAGRIARGSRGLPDQHRREPWLKQTQG